MIKPILFNTPMTQRTDDGTKTETRRNPFQVPAGYVYKGLYIVEYGKAKRLCAVFHHEDGTDINVPAPYLPGDVLWVRETWADYDRYYYKATEPDAAEPIENSDPRWFKWRPSIHMPKEAARLFLRVKDVRVERLRDIECIATEGVTMVSMDTKRDPRYYFAKLWNSTIKPADLPRYGWDANPWVWVIEFEQCEKPAGWPGEAGEGGG